MSKQILCLFLSISLIWSCKKSDSSPPQPTSAALLNTWRVNNGVYVFTDKTITVYNRASGASSGNLLDLSSLRYAFKADSTYLILDQAGQENGTWTLKNDDLTLTETGTNESDTYQVDKLDSSTLVLSETTSAADLSQIEIAYLNQQFNVDASNGFKVTYTLTPN